MSNPKPRQADLTRELTRDEIRLELVTVCYRADRTATQIIAMAKELEQYVISGQPLSEVR
jgi:hypothetical protein